MSAGATVNCPVVVQRKVRLLPFSCVCLMLVTGLLHRGISGDVGYGHVVFVRVSATY